MDGIVIGTAAFVESAARVVFVKLRRERGIMAPPLDVRSCALPLVVVMFGVINCEEDYVR